MRRNLAGYSLLTLYAFGFFTVVFHTVAHAQAPTQEIKERPKVLGASTTVREEQTVKPNPTPTLFISNLVQPQTLPSVTPTPTKTATTPTPTKPTEKTLPAATTPVTTTAETPPPPPPAAPQSTANVGGLDAERLFTMSNDYRASKGLPPLQKDERSCNLAASRSPEVAGEVASGALHSGLHARALPYWNTENIISMNSEEGAFNWWLNDPIHHQAIVGNFTYSCVSCTGNNCAQEFTNYQAK